MNNEVKKVLELHQLRKDKNTQIKNYLLHGMNKSGYSLRTGFNELGVNKYGYNINGIHHTTGNNINATMQELAKLNQELATNMKQGKVISDELHQAIDNEELLLNNKATDQSALLTAMVTKGKLASKLIELLSNKANIINKINTIKEIKGVLRYKSDEVYHYQAS